MEQVQPLCMEYFEVEDEEVEFPLCEEGDYPSLCIEEYTDQLKNEDTQDELIGVFSEYPQMTSDHLSKKDPLKNLTISNLLLTRMKMLEVIKMVVLVVLSLNTS